MRVSLLALLALLACSCVLLASASTADASAELLPGMPSLPSMSPMLSKLTMMDDESSVVSVPMAAAPLTELEQLEAQAAAEFAAENGGAMVELASHSDALSAVLAEVDAEARLALAGGAKKSAPKRKVVAELEAEAEPAAEAAAEPAAEEHTEETAFFLALDEHSLLEAASNAAAEAEVEQELAASAEAEAEADGEMETPVYSDAHEMQDVEFDYSPSVQGDRNAALALQAVLDQKVDASGSSGLQKPRIEGRPVAPRMAAHHSNVARMRTMFDRVAKNAPAPALAGESLEERYLSHVF